MNMHNQLSVKETMALENGKQRKLWRRWFFIFCILLLLIGTALFFTLQKKAAPGPSFQSSAVTNGSLEITVTATGNLEATNQVDVGSELSGRVTEVLVDFNDSVSKGQPLAYLDNTKFAAAVQKSKAEVEAAKAAYQEALATRDAAGKAYERYQKTHELTKGQMPSIEILQEAEAEYNKAVAIVDSAKAAIDSAEASRKVDETDLAKTIIYSPTDGIILTRDIDEGQTVAASLEAPVLFVVAEDLRRMELQVDIDEADVGQVKEGQQAHFTVDAYPDHTFDATITQVRYGAETTDGVVTYTAVLQVQNPDLLLRPGMTATAEIIVKEVTESLLVPNTALRFSPSLTQATKENNRSFLSSLMPGPPPRNTGGRPAAGANNIPAGKARLWVTGADGMPSPLQVTKIATNGIMTAVSSDTLKEGMQVITNEITKPRG